MHCYAECADGQAWKRSVAAGPSRRGGDVAGIPKLRHGAYSMPMKVRNKSLFTQRRSPILWRLRSVLEYLKTRS